MTLRTAAWSAAGAALALLLIDPAPGMLGRSAAAAEPGGRTSASAAEQAKQAAATKQRAAPRRAPDAKAAAGPRKGRAPAAARARPGAPTVPTEPDLRETALWWSMPYVPGTEPTGGAAVAPAAVPTEITISPRPTVPPPPVAAPKPAPPPVATARAPRVKPRAPAPPIRSTAIRQKMPRQPMLPGSIIGAQPPETTRAAPQADTLPGAAAFEGPPINTGGLKDARSVRRDGRTVVLDDNAPKVAQPSPAPAPVGPAAQR